MEHARTNGVTRRRFGAATLALALLQTIFAPATRAAAETALTLSRGAHGAETLELNLADLEAMPQVTIVTENEFTDGPVAYRGPLVRDVIDRLALGSARTLRFIAANDYYVDIPTAEMRDYDVILAMEADGQRLSRRDKGPLWLMYPISDHEALKDPRYIHKLIWQVVRIEAL